MLSKYNEATKTTQDIIYFKIELFKITRHKRMHTKDLKDVNKKACY